MQQFKTPGRQFFYTMETNRHISLPRKALVVCFVTFFVVLPFMYCDKPFSIYYQLRQRNTIDVVSELSKVREQAVMDAVTYFQNSTPADNTKSGQGDIQPPYIAIGILTVKRKITNNQQTSSKYVMEVAARVKRLLNNVDLNSQPRIQLSICNLDYEYDKYEEAVFLSKYIHVINIYASVTKVDVLKHSDHYEKEQYDYGLCLREIAKFNAKYTLILEDDALLHWNFFEVLHYVLTTKIEQKYVRGDLVDVNRDNFVALKLYYPEKWQGYGWEWLPLSDLGAFGFAGGMFNLCFERRCRANGRRPFKHRVLLFIMFMVYFILVAKSIGRQNMQRLRSISPQLYFTQKAPTCCTQAVLYSQRNVGKIVEYLLSPSLKSSNKFPLDIAISKKLDDLGLESLIVVPNLVDHIGVFSSLPKKPRIPY
ncbi:GPI-N-acetylgalactosamine transferase PGAP4-like [Glandiceps talaboti]